MDDKREPRLYLSRAAVSHGTNRGEGATGKPAHTTQHAPKQPQHTQQPTMHDTKGRERNLYNAHEIHTQATIIPTQYTHNAANKPQLTGHAATPMQSTHYSLKTTQLNLKPENFQQKLNKSTQMPENLKYRRQKSTQTAKRNLAKTTKSTQVPQNYFQLQKSTQTPENAKQKLVATCTQMKIQTQVTQTSKHPKEKLEQLLPIQADPKGTFGKLEKEKPIFKIPEVSEETLIRHLGTILDHSKKAEARREKDESLEEVQKPLRNKTQEHTKETAHPFKSLHSTYSLNEPDPSEDAVQVTGFIRPRLLEQRAKYLREERHPLKILVHSMEKQTLKPPQPTERKPKLLQVIQYILHSTKYTFRPPQPISHKPKPLQLHPWQNVSQTTQPRQQTQNQASPLQNKAEADQQTREPQPPIGVEKDRLTLLMEGIYGARGVETCTEDEDMMAFLTPTSSREVKDIVTLTMMGNDECKEIVTNERQSEHEGNPARPEENLTGAVMGKQSEPKKEPIKLKGILKKPKEETEPEGKNLIKPKEIVMRKEPESMKESIKLQGILKKPKEKETEPEDEITVSKEQPRKVISKNKVEQKNNNENLIEPEIKVIMPKGKELSKISMHPKPNLLSDSSTVSPKKVRPQCTSRVMDLEKEMSTEETTFIKITLTEKPKCQENERREMPPVSFSKITPTENPVCEKDEGEMPSVLFSKMIQTENPVYEEDEEEIPPVSPVSLSKMTQTESPTCQEDGIGRIPPISSATIVTHIDFNDPHPLTSLPQESQALETQLDSPLLEILDSDPQSINESDVLYCHQRETESRDSARHDQETSSPTSDPNDCTTGELSDDTSAYLTDDQESSATSQYSSPGQQDSKDYKLDKSWFRMYQYFRRKNKLEELYKKMKIVQLQLTKQAKRLQKTVNVPGNKEDLTHQVQNLNQQMESEKVNLRAAMDEEKKHRKCCEELSNNLQGIKKERKKLLSDRELLQKEINLTQQEKFNLDARKCYQQSLPTSRQEQKGEYLKRYEHDLTLRVSKADEAVESNRREIYNMERNHDVLDAKRRESRRTIKAISCKMINIKKKQHQLVELHNNILTAKTNTHKIKRFRAHAKNIKQQVSRLKEVISTLQKVPSDKCHHIPTLAAALPDIQKQTISWMVTEQSQCQESKEQEDLSGHHLLVASDMWRVSTFQSKHRPQKTSTKSWTVELRDAAPRYVVIRVDRNDVWAVTDNTGKSRFE
ncbi:titin-like [Scylla paramamosain]|uniref:titin-like n=1 Tax=Scylla paramamosain TaxID=85552 RepID=UPI0030833216